jgi:hypothetical protein
VKEIGKGGVKEGKWKIQIGKYKLESKGVK